MPNVIWHPAREAPINDWMPEFAGMTRAADYGLVGDLFEVIPQFEKLV